MLKDVLKKAYWKLPLSSEFKNKLSAKRYERILAKEAKADARGDTPVFDDAELLKEYAEYVLSSCGSARSGIANTPSMRLASQT